MDTADYYKETLAEAQKGYDEGGIPIGSILVHKGKIIGRGTTNGYKMAA